MIEDPAGGQSAGQVQIQGHPPHPPNQAASGPGAGAQAGRGRELPSPPQLCPPLMSPRCEEALCQHPRTEAMRGRLGEGRGAGDTHTGKVQRGDADREQDANRLKWSIREAETERKT